MDDFSPTVNIRNERKRNALRKFERDSNVSEARHLSVVSFITVQRLDAISSDLERFSSINGQMGQSDRYSDLESSALPPYAVSLDRLEITCDA